MITNLRNIGVLSEDSFDVNLLRDKHVSFILGGMSSLSSGWSALDASRPWLCYWTIHSLSLLDRVPSGMEIRVSNSLKACQHPDGGFGGGFMQIAHCAPTYASICALLTSGITEGYKVINRPKLYNFLLSMKQKDGGFSMHIGGETDVRATVRK
jgi:prenyltransferase beta subunit